MARSVSSTMMAKSAVVPASDVRGIVATSANAVYNMRNIQERVRAIRSALFGEFPVAVKDSDKAAYNADGVMGEINSNCCAVNDIALEAFDDIEFLERKLGLSNDTGNPVSG